MSVFNPSTIIEQIKKVGNSNCRVVYSPGKNNERAIEIREGNEWKTIANGLTESMANDIIKQASSNNRLLLG